MAAESKHTEGQYTCPLCAMWAAYRNSEAAKHLRGIQRESLLLVHSLLNACISGAEKHVATETPPASEGKQ